MGLQQDSISSSPLAYGSPRSVGLSPAGKFNRLISDTLLSK